MKKLVLLPLCLFFTACTQVSVVALNDYVAPRTPSTKPVTVFLSRESVKRKYREIAMLTSNSEVGHETAMNFLKKEAQRLGADAVIVLAAPGSTAFGYGYSVATQQAVAIIYEAE